MTTARIREAVRAELLTALSDRAKRPTGHPFVADYLAEALSPMLGEWLAEERERIARAIEAVQSPSLSVTENGHLEHAARIARAGAAS